MTSGAALTVLEALSIIVPPTLSALGQGNLPNSTRSRLLGVCIKSPRALVQQPVLSRRQTEFSLKLA
jgi:hypothetical protein